jgi:hypothetical protein
MRKIDEAEFQVKMAWGDLTRSMDKREKERLLKKVLRSLPRMIDAAVKRQFEKLSP